MADREIIYVIPLRDAWNATYKTRSKRAINIIKDFAKRHMKSENVKIGENLNKKIWENGRKNPPRRVKVRMVNQDDSTWVELVDFKFNFEILAEKAKEEAKKKEKKVEDAKLKSKDEAYKDTVKEEAKKEAPAEQDKTTDSKEEKKAPVKKAKSEKKEKTTAKKTSAKKK